MTLLPRWTFQGLKEGTFRILQQVLRETTVQASDEHAQDSGTGSTSTFTIPHGLGREPNFHQVTPGSADAGGEFYTEIDDTNITVIYKTSPPSGTNNLEWHWMAG